MRKYLCILNYCRIFASEKETNNKLNPKTRKGNNKMATFNVNNKSIEVSDAEIMAIINKCMKNVEYDPEKEAKKEARRAARREQREADFQECIRFCERAKAI